MLWDQPTDVLIFIGITIVVVWVLFEGSFAFKRWTEEGRKRRGHLNDQAAKRIRRGEDPSRLDLFEDPRSYKNLRAMEKELARWEQQQRETEEPPSRPEDPAIGR